MLLCYRLFCYDRAISAVACPFLGCFYTQFQLFSVAFHRRKLLFLLLPFLSRASSEAISEWMAWLPWKEIPSFGNYQWKWSLHTRSEYTHRQNGLLPRLHENSIKTLIIWETLRNCVFHVTFYYYFPVFITHQPCIDCSLSVVAVFLLKSDTFMDLFYDDKNCTFEVNWLPYLNESKPSRR